MKSRYSKIVVMIPAYNPDDKLLSILDNIGNSGFSKVIVVDDGSKKECERIFEEATENFLKMNMEGVLLKHSINLGQGRAYKTAFNYYLEHFSDSVGVIQCDADGQHHIEDVKRCADLLLENPNTFILGVRDFDAKGIPFRSRFGNKCTNFVFRVFCGLDIKDTQTGLKGIPSSFIPRLMETPGERFEYASSVLLETKKAGIDILQFPIQTVYVNGNETSHFNPLIDSIRIYSLILKYLASSLSAFIIDIVAFSIFLAIINNWTPTNYILVSTYMAKIISCGYSFVINKKFVFEHRSKGISIVIKYLILCLIQSSLSGIFTTSLVGWLHWSEVLSKIVVDTILFFMSFQVQNRWVFGKNVNKD